MSMRLMLTASALALMAVIPAGAWADDDSTQSAAASRDSVVASARLTAAGVRLVAGVAFAPVRRTLRDSDRAARAVGESGRIVDDSANGRLDVSPETVQGAPKPQPAPNVPYDTKDDRDAPTAGEDR